MEENPMDKISPFQKLLLVLSIYVVIELYVGTLYNYSPELKSILEWIDFGICMLFLYDFTSGILKAEDKWKYFKTNWIDLISSIPTIDALRFGRLVRIIRILRVFRSAKFIFNFFSRKNSFSTLKNLIIIGFVIIMLFTFSFYHLEKGINPNIQDMGDSLWWTTITTITVGFLQDIPPVTVEGKFLSVALILLGMVMFSTLTGTITDFFIEDENIVDQLDDVKEKMSEMDEKLNKIAKQLEKLNNNS